MRIQDFERSDLVQRVNGFSEGPGAWSLDVYSRKIRQLPHVFIGIAFGFADNNRVKTLVLEYRMCG
jgi:hypothetical protein